MNSNLEAETEVEIENNELGDELPQLVIDAATTEGAKSTGVGSTDSNDSGLAGDHSSPEHDRRFARRRPHTALKMPPYPGFGWTQSQNANENGYYSNYDKYNPVDDAAIEGTFGMESSNSNSHIVYVHINIGETLSVRVGNDVQQIPGPATVRMVTSQNSGPPAALPLHVPPGHIVQQILDEFGTLRHLVLSPQPVLQPSPFTGPFQAVSMPSGYITPTVQFTDPHGSQSFYDGNFYSISPVPSNTDDHASVGILDTCDINYSFDHEYQGSVKQNPKDMPFSRRPSYKHQLSAPPTGIHMRDGVDDRYRTVPPRIGGRRKRYGPNKGQPNGNYYNNRSYLTNDRYTGRPPRVDDRNRYAGKAEGNRYTRPSHENNYDRRPVENHYKVPFEPVQNETVTSTSMNGACNDEDEPIKITEMLSRIPAPKVCDIGPRSALIKWQPFDCSEASANGGPFPQIDASEFTYEILVYEDVEDEKPQQSYRCLAELFPQKLLTNLKPVNDYFVRLRASLEERDICGAPSSAVAFRTKPCQPERPDAPEIAKRTKNWLLITWHETMNNGSQITSYHLEITDGEIESRMKSEKPVFKEVYVGLATRYQIQNLKSNTIYQVRVAASNLCGKSDYSDIIFAKTSGGAPSEPDKPTLVKATANSLTLQWIKRDIDEEFHLFMDDGKTGFLPATVTRDTTYTANGLFHFQEYKFRLMASNEDGRSPPSEVAVFCTLPPKPSPPSKPAVIGTVSDRIRINWESGNDITKLSRVSYLLQMKTTSSAWVTIFEGAQREYEVLNLDAGSCNYFRVLCETEGGQSEYSEELQVVIPAAPPGPCNPPSLKEPPQSTILDLIWNLPKCTGGMEITYYELSITGPKTASSNYQYDNCEKPSCFNGEIIYRGSSTSFVITSDLKPGSTYAFSVRASNAVGFGPWSDQFECRTAAAPPDCPRHLRLVELNSKSARLAWDQPELNNGAPVTEYFLHCACRKDGSAGHSTVGTPTNDHSLNLIGPARFDGCQNEVSNTENTDRSAKAPGVRERQPSTSSIASDMSDDCVFSGDTPVGAMAEIYAGSDLSFETTSLRPATEYVFCVQAANIAGKSRLSNALFCRTPADVPEIPKIVKVEPISMTQILVCWEHPMDNGSSIQAYHLEISTLDVNSGLMFPLSLSGTCTQYMVENLLPETTYRFRLRAVSDIGISDFSPVIQATTFSSPPLPPKMELLSSTHCSLKLKWHDTANDTTITYTLEMENKPGVFMALVNNVSFKTYKVTRLCESTSYRFRIRAISATGGIGTWSDVYEFTTTKAPPPSVKYSPKVLNITETSCEIEWQPIKLNFSTSNSMEKVFYNLQIRAVPSSSRSYSANETFESVYKGPATSFFITGLEPDAMYKVRVYSVRVVESGDEIEGAPSPMASFSTVSSILRSSEAGNQHANGRFGRRVLIESVNFLRGDRQISDSHWAMLILMAFGFIALLVACTLNRFIPESITTANNGSLDEMQTNPVS